MLRRADSDVPPPAEARAPEPARRTVWPMAGSRSRTSSRSTPGSRRSRSGPPQAGAFVPLGLEPEQRARLPARRRHLSRAFGSRAAEAVDHDDGRPRSPTSASASSGARACRSRTPTVRPSCASWRSATPRRRGRSARRRRPRVRAAAPRSVGTPIARCGSSHAELLFGGHVEHRVDLREHSMTCRRWLHDRVEIDRRTRSATPRPHVGSGVRAVPVRRLGVRRHA